MKITFSRNSIGFLTVFCYFALNLSFLNRVQADEREEAAVKIQKAFRHHQTSKSKIRLQLSEDPEVSFGAGYIYPNESHPEYFKNAFEKSFEGTLVSVGPAFRALIGASLGNFNRIVLLDLDPNINNFNKLHLELLRNIGKLPIPSKFQRYQYLAALHCKWLESEQLALLEELEGDASSLKPLNSEFLKMLDSFVPSGEACSLESAPKEIQATILSFQNLHLDFGRSSPPPFFTRHSKVEENFLGGYYYSFTSKEDYKRERPSYYWENDAGWQKVQKLAQNGDRLRVVAGDIYGKYAFSSLGNELRKRGEQVSVVDVSNILDYLRGPYEFDEETEYQKATYQRFLSNLRGLPHRDETLVLRTTRTLIAGALKDQSTYHWTYYWSKLESLISKANPSQTTDWFIHEE